MKKLDNDIINIKPLSLPYVRKVIRKWDYKLCLKAKKINKPLKKT